MILKEKILDPELVAALDSMIDEDKLKLSSEREMTDFERSEYELGDFINLVINPLLPDWLTINYNKKCFQICDKRRGIEYTYVKWQITPIVSPDSLTRCKDDFERKKLIAQKRQKLGKKTKIKRGEFFFYPQLEFNRLNMEFEEGGVVPCGLPNGADCVPAKLGDTDALLGLGEFVWCRPAAAALDPNFDLEKGLEVLNQIHEEYRLKARKEGYLNET